MVALEIFIWGYSQGSLGSGSRGEAPIGNISGDKVPKKLNHFLDSVYSEQHLKISTQFTPGS